MIRARTETGPFAPTLALRIKPNLAPEFNRKLAAAIVRWQECECLRGAAHAIMDAGLDDLQRGDTPRTYCAQVTEDPATKRASAARAKIDAEFGAAVNVSSWPVVVFDLCGPALQDRLDAARRLLLAVPRETCSGLAWSDREGGKAEINRIAAEVMRG